MTAGQDEFKEFEHRAWEAAAGHYDDKFSRLTSQAIEPMLDALQVGEQTRLLDVACGPGNLAAAARSRGADVVGVDFSSAMLARARVHHPHIEFREADAERLEGLADQNFDAVAINFGILHLGDPSAALHQAHRVLRPGGRVAFTVWCPPEEARGFGLVLQAVEAAGNPNVPLPQAPPFFLFSDAAARSRLLGEVGFSQAQTRRLEQTWVLDRPEEVFEAFATATARTAGLLRGQTTEQLNRVRQLVREAAAAFAVADEIHIPMPALLTWAVK